MNKFLSICLLYILFITSYIWSNTVTENVQPIQKEFDISQYSEEYNTRYIYCWDCPFDDVDTTLYVTGIMPESFVVELGTLRSGDKTALIYNDNKRIVISNNNNSLKIGRNDIGILDCDDSKLSLYFVNGKMIVYVNERKKADVLFKLDRRKKIGVRLSKEKGFTCRYFSCYEPVAFMIADYGEALENGKVEKNKEIRMGLHNVGEAYNITFPSDIAKESKRSIRFEYRYENTKRDSANEMRRARSEISGVFSKSPKNKWIIEYDLYVPEETIDDDSLFECITQIHEGSRYPKSPSFCLKVKGGILYSNIKGDSIRIENWRKKINPMSNFSKPLIYLEKNRWYHVKLYLKEGWQVEDCPLTKIWIDDTLLFESKLPNCYKYLPQSRGHYDYLKFGIYKSGWMKAKNVDEKLQKRVYFFDNFIVKY